jgi:hypothetical protein
LNGRLRSGRRLDDLQQGAVAEEVASSIMRWNSGRWSSVAEALDIVDDNLPTP